MIFKFSKNLFLIVSVFSVFFIIPHSAFATDTASQSPATMADDSAIGAATWTNPNNAKVSDDAYATAVSVCFTAGTMIKTSGGEVAIETIHSGQYVLGFDMNMLLVNSKVTAVGSKEVNEVIKVQTDKGEITATAEHPFFIGNGKFEQIQNIPVGSYIYDTDFTPRKILSKTIIHQKTTVYNLEVDNTHTYFANNFAVHNKTIWHYLKATDFGFAIPTGATINGIRAEIEFKSNSTSGSDDVRIVKGGTIGSTNMGIFSNNFPLTDTSTFYGSDSDLWGETWTADDINSSGFGLVFSVNIFGETVSVDHMAIVVSYTPSVASGRGHAHRTYPTVYSPGSIIPATTTPPVIEVKTEPKVVVTTEVTPQPTTTSPLPTAPRFLTKDLFLGITDPEVKLLQQHLNAHDFLVATEGPGSRGNETEFFGQKTRATLVKYQKANGITPAFGFLGEVTRTYIFTH